MAYIDGAIDDAVSANAQNFNELEGVPINEGPDGRVYSGGRGW